MDARLATRPNAPTTARRSTALVVAIILTMVAGLMQAPLADIASSLPGRDVLDDALLMLAVVIALPRLGSAPLISSTFVFFWLAAAITAVLGATHVDASDEIVIARQVALPAVIIYLGMQLRDEEWATVKRAGILLGIVNACYMLIELSGFYLFDPAALISPSSIGERLHEGKPAYYAYWLGPALPTITRLGGLFLNPPIAGIAAGAALVALFHTRDFKMRGLWMLVLAAATALSFARAGWLIAVAGILIPAAVRSFGKLASVIIAIPFGLYAWAELSSHGNSASHSDGLAAGVAIAVNNVLGVGFGTFGNHAHRVTFNSDGGESLAGIAFAGMGIFAVLCVAGLAIALFRRLSIVDVRWEAALGLGIVAGALLSESAGALSGTVLAWLAVGIALRRAPQGSMLSSTPPVLRS